MTLIGGSQQVVFAAKRPNDDNILRACGFDNNRLPRQL